MQYVAFLSVSVTYHFFCTLHFNKLPTPKTTGCAHAELQQAALG